MNGFKNTNKENENYFYDKYKKSNFGWLSNRLRYLAIIFIFFFFCFWFSTSAPLDFPSGKIISIPAGSSLLKVSGILQQMAVIKSPLLFRFAVRFFGGDKGVKAGNYIFDGPQDVLTIAKRLVENKNGLAPTTVVIPEGTSAEQIADILSSKFPDFDKTKFLKISQSREGYLFPDTYDFLFDATPETMRDAMLANFEKRIATIQDEIKKFGHPLADVIKMASIVEEEGRSTEVRRTIAGILWKRIEIGMPLQVDAAFSYVNGKNTFQLVTADLATDSPYNTYTRKGLPPTPITNPGLDAILATVTPIKTPYLYYLTDSEGVMHYSKNYEEHLFNKEKYLK